MTFGEVQNYLDRDRLTLTVQRTASRVWKATLEGSGGEFVSVETEGSMQKAIVGVIDEHRKNGF